MHAFVSIAPVCGIFVCLPKNVAISQRFCADKENAVHGVPCMLLARLFLFVVGDNGDTDYHTIYNIITVMINPSMAGLSLQPFPAPLERAIHAAAAVGGVYQAASVMPSISASIISNDMILAVTFSRRALLLFFCKPVRFVRHGSTVVITSRVERSIC